MLEVEVSNRAGVAVDEAGARAAVESLPLARFMSIEIVELAPA